MKQDRRKAIITHCKDCRGGLKPASCMADFCELFPVRVRQGKIDGSITDTVKAYCLGCCNGSYNERKLCHITDCALWLYRNGSARQAFTKLIPETIIVESLYKLFIPKKKRNFSK